jgi:uncharacterized protein DUF3800
MAASKPEDWHQRGVRIAYLDETQNTGRKVDPIQPVHFVVAVAFEDADILAAHRQMRDIAQLHFPGSCRRRNFEFKGSDIYGGHRFHERAEPRDRIDLYARLLKTVPLHNGLVYVRGVDKAAAAQRGIHPHYDAVRHLLRDLAHPASTEKTMVVADHHDEYVRLGLSCPTLAQGNIMLCEPIHFAASHGSWGLQLADCVAYVCARHWKVEAGLAKQDKSAAAIDWLYREFLADRIATSVTA